MLKSSYNKVFVGFLVNKFTIILSICNYSIQNKVIMSSSQSQRIHNNSTILASSQTRVPTAVLRNLDNIIQESQQSQEQEMMEYDTLTEFLSEEEDDEYELEAPLLTELAEKVNGDTKLLTLCSFTFMEIVEIWEIVLLVRLKFFH
jgi:hypothetical protein